MEFEFNLERFLESINDEVKEKLRDLLSWFIEPLMNEVKSQLEIMNDTLKGLSRKLGRDAVGLDENGNRY